MASLTKENRVVVVYTKTNCQPCKLTKRAMEKHGIAYEEVLLDDHPEAVQELVSRGYMSAPVVVAGEDSWSGFNPAKIRSLAL